MRFLGDKEMYIRFFSTRVKALPIMMRTAIILLSCIVAALGAPAEDYSWRIVGGAKASDGQFPYQISLRSSGYHSCGGSIIDDTTILCAAHCVDGANPKYLTVVTGSNKLNSGGDTYKVESIAVNKDWDWGKLQNDISILKLSESISFNGKVQPVKIRQNPIPGDENAVLSGWGTTQLGGPTPNDLQWINLKTLSHEDCKKKQTNYPIAESQVCTLTKSGEGACHGDSGGPLVDDNGEQIGIVSWGTPCARGEPDVFTRVTGFLDWIEENRK